MHWFYAPNIQAGTYTLESNESAHCTRVLRLKAGDAIWITDGQNRVFEARIIAPDARNTMVETIAIHTEWEKRMAYLHIAVAPTKVMDRFEWLIEKLTEIGVDEITPILCRFSERKVLKTERLHKIMQSALKQSQKAIYPKLNELTPFNQFVAHTQGQRFVAHCAEGNRMLLRNACVPGQAATILIGPEGDFSSDEITFAIQHGFNAISLGPSRLRTETAAMVACATVAVLNQ